MSDVAPWWLTIASGIVLALVGAIGKLWSENRTLRRENGELAAKLADVQAAGFREHRRDLRMIAGLPMSGAPPAALDPLRPPILIREAAPRRRNTVKKATE